MKTTRRHLDPSQPGDEAVKLENDLRQRIVGQDEAIGQVAGTYQTDLAGMSDPGRPVGIMLFLGPTGSGKTRLVEATAESIMGDRRAVIKINCAEFQHSHEIAKLLGAPPGYLGHRETHALLSQEALNAFYTETRKLSIVLFDEIEKASDALWNLLLGILDKATLTLGDNRHVDFSRALIFMTSNLGAAEMNAIIRPRLGFGAGEEERRQASNVAREKNDEKLANAGINAARRKFTPEFMNRIDKVVVFRQLTPPELRRIIMLELDILQGRILQSMRFTFHLTDPAIEFLLGEGTNTSYGARYLKRAINQHLTRPLSNLVATGQVRGGDSVEIGFDAESRRLTFDTEEEEVPYSIMVTPLVDKGRADLLKPALALSQPGSVAAVEQTEDPRLHTHAVVDDSEE